MTSSPQIKAPGQDNVLTNPRIYAAVILVMVPLVYILFQPTLWEFLGFFFVDTLAYSVANYANIRLFHRLYPRSKYFFPDLHPDIEKLSTLEQRTEIYDEMLAFPGRRSLFYLYLGLVKIIPGTLFIVFVWGDHGHQFEALLKTLAIVAFTFSFPTAMSYLAYHQKMSQQLHEIHESYNWVSVFRQARVLSDRSALARMEMIAIASIFSCFCVIVTVIVTDRTQPVWFSAFGVMFTAISAGYFIFHILQSSRVYTMDGIRSLVAHQTQTVGRVNPNGLSLSTDPQLAYYQKAINNLVEQVIRSEREASTWMLKMVEESRYRDLGEGAALLIHDQLTPITTMEYCTQILMSKQPHLKEDQYFRILRDALQRQQGLVANLRSSIRGDSDKRDTAELRKANEAAIILTGYKNFDNPGFSQIRFDSRFPDDLNLQISQIELNQILTNLFSNAAENLIKNEVENPEINLKLLEDENGEVTLGISDNGTGLSLGDFKALTEGVNRVEGGAGLMLTRKLILRRGGDLELGESINESGTHFLLRLPKHSRRQGAESSLN